MNKHSIPAFLLIIISVISCDQIDDKAVLGLPFEISKQFTINKGANADSLFTKTLTFDPKEDSSVVSNVDQFNGIEIDNLYYKISGVTASDTTYLDDLYIAYGKEEDLLLDTLVHLDSLNLAAVKGEDFMIELDATTTDQLNSILTTKEPFYIFVEGTTSEVPMKFTLTMWAEIILRVGV